MPNAASVKSMLNEPPKVIFPCDYPIKIIGENHSDFKSQVTTVLENFVPDFDQTLASTRISARGTWIALTVNIIATGKPQLDAIFHDLKACSRVRLVL